MMDESKKTNFRVGFLTFGALIIATLFVFTIGSRKGMFDSKSTYFSNFKSVAGLKPGNIIQMAGVTLGNVKSVKIDKNGTSNVTLEIKDEFQELIREDSVVSIAMKGLLGGKIVNISAGKQGVLPPESWIKSKEPTDFSTYSEQAGEIIEQIQETIDNLTKITGPLSDPAFSSDLKSTVKNLSTITHLAAEGKGTIGRLLHDKSLGNDVDQTVRQVKATSQEVSKITKDVRAMTQEIRKGEGVVHELVYGKNGEALVANLEQVTKEIDLLLKNTREGKGALHELIYEDSGSEVVTNLADSSASLKKILKGIEDGNGTIGALLVDPSIYEDVKRLVGDLNRNETLKALVRYSIDRDQKKEKVKVQEEKKP